MSFYLKDSESKLEGNSDYKNSEGKHECAIFVQQASRLPNSTLWKKGLNVFGNGDKILRGTAIATFGADGNYNGNPKGKHAAIYISQNSQGIVVYDQWNNQGKVKKRTIRKNGSKFVDIADNFYVIEI